MKVYYFLADMDEWTYNFLLNKVDLINQGVSPEKIIANYCSKIWQKDSTGKICNSAFLEFIVFVDYYRKKLSGHIDDIQIVRRENFMIFNEKIFVYESGDFVEIKEEILFATSRDMWTNLFFWFLTDIASQDSKIKIMRPNFKKDWNYNDKLYFFHKLYTERKKFLGNVIIPFLMKPDYGVLNQLFVKSKSLLWEKVVLKNSFGNMWQWVRALDLWNDLEVADLHRNFFNNKHYNYRWQYLTPWYDIKNEYRVYYLYDKKKESVRIYSVKNRINEIDNSIFSKENLELNKNLKTKWEYCNPNDFIQKDIYGFTEDTIRKIWYETWVLEVMETTEGKFLFIELNYMWWNLMFANEDEQFMQDFYMDMYDMVYNNSLDSSL